MQRNDSRIREGFAYSDIAAAEADVVGGRYGAEVKTRTVGSAQFKYPRLLDTSPWASDPLPAEPLIDAGLAAPVVGETFEVEKSLGEMRDDAGSSPPAVLPDSLGGEPWRVGDQRGVAGSGSPPSTKRKSRKRG